MKILYGSGNILVSPSISHGHGSSTQIAGFVSGLEQAGHTVVMDISGKSKQYPKIRGNLWLKWLKTFFPPSWLVYEQLQIRNNHKVYERLTQMDLHSFDLFWQRYELFTTAYSTVAKERQIPNILFVDAPLIIERQQSGYLWQKKRAMDLLRKNAEIADAIVTISKAVQDYVYEYTGLDKLNIHIMSNGFSDHIVNTTAKEIDQIREKYLDGFKGTVIGFVGYIKPWQALQYLVQAASRLAQERDDFRVLIVGDGPELAYQKQLTSQLGLEHLVKFTGNIPFANIAPYLNLFDIGVMSNSNLYRSPMKISEYMACGAAVVAPNLPPIAALCTSGEHGLLFAKDSVDELEQSIKTLLDSPELLTRLQKNARQYALENYSWQAKVRQIEPIMKDIAARYEKKSI